MSISPFDSQIFGPLLRDELIVAIFSDASFVRKMLAFEATLARVQGKLGIIPSNAATVIETAVSTFQVDYLQLQQESEKAGVPVIGLLKQLRQAVATHGGREAADAVHWGATTQDVMDTAVILQIRDALDLLETKLNQTITQLAQLAHKHRHTLMAGRTHSQQALPIPFGLKVAAWLAPLLRHQQRLAEMKPRLLVVQFGGAAGTLAALGQMGTAVQEKLAAEFSLNLPLMPWHTQRDNLAACASWLSLVSASLAKMAQDIILLAQTEIGELRETADTTRGGSSTMPQKSNPIVSELIIAAARTNASLLANMHQAMVQEHERATHGWQMEWLTLPQMFGLTAVALNKALWLSENLVVNEARMRQNVAASNGLMLAEAITFALTPLLGRTAAKRLVETAVQITVTQDQHLIDVVQEKTDAPLNWKILRNESAYFGSSDSFIDNILREVDSPHKNA